MSKFKILGHPIHPMLIPLPIGLIVATFLADIAYFATDKDMTWYDAATVAGAAVVITGAIAALPGLADFLTIRMSGRARLVALVHMVTNVGVLAAFGAAFLLMINEGATGGSSLAAVIVLHSIGAGLVTISGYLGGELVYKHGIAVERMELDAREAEREPAAAGGSSAGSYRKGRPIV